MLYIVLGHSHVDIEINEKFDIMEQDYGHAYELNCHTEFFHGHEQEIPRHLIICIGKIELQVDLVLLGLSCPIYILMGQQQIVENVTKGEKMQIDHYE